MGGTLAKNSSHSSDSCDESRRHQPCPVKEDPFMCCDKLCCSNLCKTDCTIDCNKKCEQILCFETGLSYQALLSGGDDPARPLSQLFAPQGVCGKLQLCFDKLMSKICYRITICGATTTGNPNTQVTSAFLYNADACTGINFGTSVGKIFVPLIPLSTGECGLDREPLCFTGTITMQALVTAAANNGNATAQTTSIDCIYSQALNGNLSVQVFGSDCVSGVEFGFTGLLRGTLRPCYPTCHTRD